MPALTRSTSATKTGVSGVTLSESDARIVDFVVAPGVDRAQLLREIAAVQTGSGHPIARAFRSAQAADSTLLARAIRVLPGAGIEGTLPDGTTLQVGNDGILASGDGSESLRGYAFLPCFRCIPSFPVFGN